MANSVDPDQMPRFVASDLGQTVCKGLSVPILRVIMVSDIRCQVMAINHLPILP